MLLGAIKVGRRCRYERRVGGAGGRRDSTRDVAQRIDPTFGTMISTINLAPDGRGSLPSSPTTLAAGAGSVWFANQAAGVVQSPDRGYVTSETDVGNHASGIAVGAGATWVADDMDDTVSRIDPNGGVSATIAVGRGASGIAVGGGAVWVADTLDDALARIDPPTDSVTNTVRVGIGPRGVAWGDGSVWVANSGDGTVSRVDPRTDRVTATIHIGHSPQALLVTGGTVWVTVQARPIAPTSAPGGRPGVLRMLRQRPFASLDPPLASFLDADQQQLLCATCAGLLMPADRPGAQGDRLVPDAAQVFPIVSRDGRTYTFTVRRGFRFSPPSSTPLTADTFKDTIERALSPRVGGTSPRSWATSSACPRMRPARPGTSPASSLRETSWRST